MSKVRNQFTTEFKQECVNLVVNQGYGIKGQNLGTLADTWFHKCNQNNQ